MEYEITYVGGPLDGQKTYFSYMGTTWSRKTYKDEDGTTLGFYYHWGPDQFTLEWESIEDFRAREDAWMKMLGFVNE